MSLAAAVLSGLNPIVVVFGVLFWKLCTRAKFLPNGCRVHSEVRADRMGTDERCTPCRLALFCCFGFAAAACYGVLQFAQVATCYPACDRGTRRAKDTRRSRGGVIGRLREGVVFRGVDVWALCRFSRGAVLAFPGLGKEGRHWRVYSISCCRILRGSRLCGFSFSTRVPSPCFLCCVPPRPRQYDPPEDVGEDPLSDDFTADKVSGGTEDYDNIVVGSDLGGTFVRVAR